MARAIGGMCILNSPKKIDGSFGRCRSDPNAKSHCVRKKSAKKGSEANDCE